MIKARRRSLCANLAILNKKHEVEFAVEVKYEPDHKRGFGAKRNIWPTKLSPSVVFWGKEGVEKDVERGEQFVRNRNAKEAVTLLIDEGRFFRHRTPPHSTSWIDWDCGGKNSKRISLLMRTTKRSKFRYYIRSAR